jgi:hypothetical protein
MASFDSVNYSLRTNKTIQRGLVFAGLQQLQRSLDLSKLIYVGLGSVWFTDFTVAHKMLRIQDMISIEADEIGVRRAKFNKPFKTVRIEHGFTHEVLPKLLADDALQKRPWLVWLDIERAPQNSIFIITLNASGGSISRTPQGRPQRLKSLLGSVVPDDLSRDQCQDDQLAATLISLVESFMISVAAAAARPGGFITAFRMNYRDGAPMITLGGVLPAKGAVSATRETVKDAAWPCLTSGAITVPPLTVKEAAVLQAELPCRTALTRKRVQRLGFDLDDDQIRAFSEYYLHYSLFAQIMT